jgi:hypothetical protein
MAPSTPYGLRARQQRAANTPGRDRRRSGRVQRETTFDVLRNLGRSMRIPRVIDLFSCYLADKLGDTRTCTRVQTDSIIASGGSEARGGADR